MDTQLWYDSLLIALGVLIPAAIYAGPRIYKKRKRREEERKALETKRDDLLENLSAKLAEIQLEQRQQGCDMRVLYQIQIPQLDSLEVSLKALKGEKVNGNVTAALDKIKDAKDTITKRLTDKVGCMGDSRE